MRVVLSMDDAASVDVQWEAEGGRCLALSQALVSNHHQAMGEKAERGGASDVAQEGDGLGSPAGSSGL